MGRIILFIGLALISCNNQEDMNMANSEWRYYFESGNFDFIKFDNTNKVAIYTAESMNNYSGTFSIDGTSIFIEINNSDDHHMNDKKKYQMEMRNGVLRYNNSWNFNSRTSEYEATNFKFDPEYIFKKE